MLVDISAWRKGWRTVAFLRRDPPGYRRASVPAKAESATPAITRWLSRLHTWRARQGCSPWYDRRHTAQDPLAPLIETAQRLDYGAGQFTERHEHDDN